MEFGTRITQENLDCLIDAIFIDSPVVYEAYSKPDHDLKILRSKLELTEYIKAAKDNAEHSIHLCIYYPKTNGHIQKRKIDLIPEKCKGAKIRFTMEGWGFIQLQIGFKATGMFCDIGSNSEKRAIKWEPTYPELQSPDLWDWKEVARQCRRLKYVLKKCG